MLEGESHPYTSRYRPQVDPSRSRVWPRCSLPLQLSSHLSKCHHLHATTNLLMKQSCCFSVGQVPIAQSYSPSRLTSRRLLDCPCCANRTAEPRVLVLDEAFIEIFACFGLLLVFPKLPTSPGSADFFCLSKSKQGTWIGFVLEYSTRYTTLFNKTWQKKQIGSSGSSLKRYLASLGFSLTNLFVKTVSSVPCFLFRLPLFYLIHTT